MADRANENRDFSIADIRHAHLEAKIEVSNIKVEKHYHHYFAGAYFSFNCGSRIATDEKDYVAQQFHQQYWGFDPLYEPLFLFKFKGKIIQVIDY